MDLGDHNIIRWLLRVLAEPSFLRIYLEDLQTQGFDRRNLEDTFWALSADTEHPEPARERAWRLLECLPLHAQPTDWYRHVLTLLSQVQHESHMLARFWALPELFPLDIAPGPVPGFFETHCHLRGAVPYLWLWEHWLDDEPLRANLRRHECRAGSWKKPWSILVKQAKDLEGQIALRRSACVDMSNFISTLAQQATPCKSIIAYLAICTSLRRCLLYQRGEIGLSPFVLAYDRYAKVQKCARPKERAHMREMVQAILDRMRRSGVDAIELRPTLERKPAELSHKLHDIILGYLDDLFLHPQEPILLGLVPSLFKQENLPDLKLPARTQRARDLLDEQIVWERQSRTWCDQVRTLITLLENDPVLRYFVIGVDAAGKEQGCPPRVLAPAVAEIRAYHRRHATGSSRPGRCMDAAWLCRLAQDYRKRPEDFFRALAEEFVPSIRLGITIHAGEDFIDPMTGLRHIWEALHNLGLKNGDRIGHALAAGLNPDTVRWLLDRRGESPSCTDVQKLSNGRFRLSKPRGTHLLDLAWERHMETPDPHSDDRLIAVASGAFGHPPQANRLAQAIMHTPSVCPMLPGVRFADPTSVIPEDRDWVMLDQGWFQRFEHLRLEVLRLLIRRAVAVESCPSSNIAVANLQTPPLLEFLQHPALVCTVATDDPGLMGCWPEDELGYAIADWDRLLKNNKSASFIMKAPGSGPAEQTD